MKYNIKYKALDSREDTIIKFLVGKGYKCVHNKETNKTMVFIWDDGLHVDLKQIVVREYRNTIQKHLGYSNKNYQFGFEPGGWTPFEKDELQFFDKLGFEIEEIQTEHTGQTIEEWF